MLKSLHDSHVFFLSPKRVEEWRELDSGKINGGIGITLGYLDGYIYVFRVTPDSPAAKAGIKRFDKILAVDNTGQIKRFRF
jgi:carboxyl-terminal processing protease